jgi:hypothetical protein
LELGAADDTQADERAAGLSVVRVELDRLLEEGPSMSGFTLGERLATEFGDLLRQRRRLGASGHDARHQQAAQCQRPGTFPPSRGSGHVFELSGR